MVNITIRDVNSFPALAQPYRDKVAFMVRGLTNFPTYIRQNPDWEDLDEKFNVKRLLTDFKNGPIMSIAGMKATKADIDKYDIMLAFNLYELKNI